MMRDEACSTEEACVTCGDVAVELRVVAIDEGRELALCVDEGGRRETVEIALVAPVTAGECLLVHAGTAIAKLSTDRDTPGREAEEVSR